MTYKPSEVRHVVADNVALSTQVAAQRAVIAAARALVDDIHRYRPDDCAGNKPWPEYDALHAALAELDKQA